VEKELKAAIPATCRKWRKHMSSRERWIVYPLLFLTLGIAIRDKFLPAKRLMVMNLMAGEVVSPRIHCHELDSVLCECRDFTVFNQKGRPAVKAVTLPNQGGGVVETYAPNGRALVKLWPSESGGAVVTIGPSNQISVYDHTGFHPSSIWKWPVLPPRQPEKSPQPDQKENQ
jgi:hypothetical protein